MPRYEADLSQPGDQLALHPVDADPAAPSLQLYRHAIEWTCHDGLLRAWVLSSEPIELPVAEASEPRLAALARLSYAVPLPNAILILRDAGSLVAQAQVEFLHGARLLHLASDTDHQRWDDALTAGLPVYALGDRFAVTIDGPRLDPTAAILALTYGAVLAGDHHLITRLEEDRRGVRWQLSTAASVRVVIRGGLDAAEFTAEPGTPGEWRDRGNEGCVRLVVTSADGRQAWTQPRLIMPLPEGEHG